MSKHRVIQKRFPDKPAEVKLDAAGNPHRLAVQTNGLRYVFYADGTEMVRMYRRTVGGDSFIDGKPMREGGRAVAKEKIEERIWQLEGTDPQAHAQMTQLYTKIFESPPPPKPTED